MKRVREGEGYLVAEVHSGAARRRFAIDSGAVTDEVAHVRDVHADLLVQTKRSE